MLTYRDFITAIRKLEIDRSRPVIVHASLSAFGEIQGGVETVLGALTSALKSFIMPVFTYKTMVTPELGPPLNAIGYGSGIDTNRMAEIYTPEMAADPIIGVVAEALRLHPKAERSTHPILSFAGINATGILASQSMDEPLNPIQALNEASGLVLLMGVDQTVNTSIHYAEKLVGRKQFVRWALTPEGVAECPGFPGCSDGFEAITPKVEEVTRSIPVGEAMLQAIPLGHLLDVACEMIKNDPEALLCDRKDCQRCNAVRAWDASQSLRQTMNFAE